MQQYAEAVVGGYKRDQDLFLKLYHLGLSQERAKQAVTRFNVRITHKKSKQTKVVEMREGEKYPLDGDVNDYSIETLGEA